MQISIPTNNLVNAIQAAGRAVGDRAVLPITRCVLLTAEGGAPGSGTLQIAGTDLESTIVVTMAAHVIESGKVAIPVGVLRDYVGGLIGKQTEIELSPRGRAVVVRSGRNEARIAAMHADDFPPVPESVLPTISLPARQLQQAIGQVAFAAADDGTRPVLAGVLVEADSQRLTLVATDGFRLACRVLPLPTPAEPFRLVVPAAALRHVARLLHGEQVGLAWDEQCLTCIGDRLLIRISLLDGQFPNWQVMTRWEKTTRVVAGKADWLRAARVVATLAAPLPDAILLIAEPGKLVLFSEAPEHGCRAEVRAEVDLAGRAGVSARYLQEALTALPDERVTMDLAGESGPLVLSAGEDALQVIMPLQVANWPAISERTELAEVP